MAQSNNAEDGEPLMDRSDYAEALNMYLASLDAPRDEEHRAKCHVGASACHLQLEQPQDALRHALQAIKLQPQNPAPRQSYAAALAHLGRWAEALVALVLDLEEPAATAADVLKTLADWANRHHQGEEVATDDPAKTLAAALTCPITGDLLILPTTTADGDSFTLGADASFPLPATHVNVRLQAILERLFPGHGAAATSLREVVMHLQGTSGLLEANSAVLADVQALLQQSEQHQPTALAAILRTLLQPARASMELNKVARAVQEVLGALLLLPQDVSIQDTATQALRAWVEACCGSPEPVQTSTEQPDAAAWSNRCAARAADLQVILDAAVSFAQTKPHTAVPVAHSELLLLCQQRLELADLECELCYDLLWRSIALPCGHMLCRSCVLRTLDHKPECPVCRADLADFLAARQFCEVSCPLLQNNPVWADG
ncbi:uncharacterized protein MONBRDRAFT_9070 [Monosiga brevicollis MX1]|uniref:RING-type domain-containing protein n=1 Tax=Monosiga brevicollis TaxID=81824 RepID=A9V200_MONBE|nr:uncharacterized protein MONBRDRAFT_9070 [Monosiga brevicollis MX1]EDQ88654.1 predicted protein [Monosiga brevicollis MX1]|eukprot:XP_001746758.1 hypothetical protein [Monosiga brevicollis MX1]